MNLPETFFHPCICPDSLRDHHRIEYEAGNDEWSCLFKLSSKLGSLGGWFALINTNTETRKIKLDFRVSKRTNPKSTRFHSINLIRPFSSSWIQYSTQKLYPSIAFIEYRFVLNKRVFIGFTTKLNPRQNKYPINQLWAEKFRAADRKIERYQSHYSLTVTHSVQGSWTQAGELKLFLLEGRSGNTKRGEVNKIV